ncbi:MAG: NTP transferase domain-containing protein [Candidatus Krumholzibacteriia bacterium]
MRRNDLAVILARGRSLRMGRPKGLLTVPGTHEPFVARIADLYAGWADVLVVALAGSAEDYRAVLAGRSNVRVLGEAGGDDTARTLCLAWSGRTGDPQRVWAHPVDLPLVRPVTLERLNEAAALRPERAHRPVWQGEPGHPVVIPAALVAALAGACDYHPGPAGAFLGGRCGLVEVDDPGVARDFDSPEDLEDVCFPGEPG